MFRSKLQQFAIFLALLPKIHANGSSLDITKRSVVLYQNDGNWTAHAENPSAILFLDAVSLPDAKDICASQGETLISQSDVNTFNLPLQYQTYLGNINSSQQFWTTSATSNGSEALPFICTNSAPLVDKVDTPFYNFPKANVSSNGTTYVGVRDHLAYRFQGFPYALQPVGDLRLAYPIEWYTNETGYVINATTYGPNCPQLAGYFVDNSYGLNPWGSSEACLLMNIWTPYLPGNEGASTLNLKPVMFYIHGGADSGADATFDGASLASRSDVVIVTLNWRVGNFGSLSFNDGYVDGNYGIADIVMGLKWVRDHIADFGGSPSNVTIWGQSAGGKFSMEMLLSPAAEGLFSRAILMSAALGPVLTQEEITNVTVPAVTVVCGNATGAERLNCLRGLSVDEFMNNITWSVAPKYTNLNTGAIIDGIWIANNSVAAAEAGQLNRVDYMAGSMPDEGQSLLGTLISPNETDFNSTLYSIAGEAGSDHWYPETWPAIVEESGLWNNGSNPINDYNATINAYTTVHLTCPGEQFIKAALEYNSFNSYYYYNNLRAYGLSYMESYDLCTFPVGRPDVPYYRCHGGDLYQVFGSYYIFDLPIRDAADIGQTNLQQDMWGSFARTGNPNPSMEYLEARGYNGTRDIFYDGNSSGGGGGFKWPEFNGSASLNIQYPSPFVSDLPWLEKCKVVEEELYHLP